MAAKKKVEASNVKRGRGRPPKGESVKILREQISEAQKELKTAQADLKTAEQARDRLSKALQSVKEISKLMTLAGKITVTPKRAAAARR